MAAHNDKRMAEVLDTILYNICYLYNLPPYLLVQSLFELDGMNHRGASGKNETIDIRFHVQIACIAASIGFARFAFGSNEVAFAFYVHMDAVNRRSEMRKILHVTCPKCVTIKTIVLFPT